MGIFNEKPAAENFKRGLRLIDELVENYDISEKIAEMIHHGIEAILIQGMESAVCSLLYLY